MIYVDEQLCTGCGVCVASCQSDAISLTDHSAVIDQERCISCGRCADVCLTGAIITMEVPPDPPLRYAPVRKPDVQVVRTGALTPPRPVEPGIVERMLSGLLSVAALANEAVGLKRSLAVRSDTEHRRVGRPRGQGRGLGQGRRERCRGGQMQGRR